MSFSPILSRSSSRVSFHSLTWCKFYDILSIFARFPGLSTVVLTCDLDQRWLYVRDPRFWPAVTKADPGSASRGGSAKIQGSEHARVGLSDPGFWITRWSPRIRGVDQVVVVVGSRGWVKRLPPVVPGLRPGFGQSWVSASRSLQQIQNLVQIFIPHIPQFPTSNVLRFGKRWENRTRPKETQQRRDSLGRFSRSRRDACYVFREKLTTHGTKHPHFPAWPLLLVLLCGDQSYDHKHTHASVVLCWQKSVEITKHTPALSLKLRQPRTEHGIDLDLDPRDFANTRHCADVRRTLLLQDRGPVPISRDWMYYLTPGAGASPGNTRELLLLRRIGRNDVTSACGARAKSVVFVSAIGSVFGPVCFHRQASCVGDLKHLLAFIRCPPKFPILHGFLLCACR